MVFCGLIIILLFYNILKEVEVVGFDVGIFLFIIIVISIIMIIVMVYDKWCSSEVI